jgi:hypothetical protein
MKLRLLGIILAPLSSTSPIAGTHSAAWSLYRTLMTPSLFCQALAYGSNTNQVLLSFSRVGESSTMWLHSKAPGVLYNHNRQSIVHQREAQCIVKVQLQSQLVTRNTSLRPQSRICVRSHICVTWDASLRLQSHICDYSHMFWYMLFPQIVHIYRSPQKEEWVIPFLFHEDSDLLSLDSFPLPLPFTSTLSPFPFPPSPLQHQQRLATLVA